jgi:hypothetical protein
MLQNVFLRNIKIINILIYRNTVFYFKKVYHPEKLYEHTNKKVLFMLFLKNILNSAFKTKPLDAKNISSSGRFIFIVF